MPRMRQPPAVCPFQRRALLAQLSHLQRLASPAVFAGNLGLGILPRLRCMAPGFHSHAPKTDRRVSQVRLRPPSPHCRRRGNEALIQVENPKSKLQNSLSPTSSRPLSQTLSETSSFTFSAFFPMSSIANPKSQIENFHVISASRRASAVYYASLLAKNFPTAISVLFAPLWFIGCLVVGCGSVLPDPCL